MIAGKRPCFQITNSLNFLERKVIVRHIEITDRAFEGQRIDNFLLRITGRAPRGLVYRILRSGEVRVNGGRVSPSYRLTLGDMVRVPPIKLKEKLPIKISDELAHLLESSVLLDDRDLIVIDKPAGLAVHGGSSVNFGVIEALREISGISTLELAHRIDRDTSGCLIMCKRRAALLEIQNAFRERKVKKIYDLYVYGDWSRKKRRVALPLLRYLTHSGERRVKVDADGKPSITDFEVEAKKEKATHLRASLVTGRTHQIRVHAQVSGHPVMGDTKYAPLRKFEQTRLCLHSSRLKIRFGDRDLDVVAPLPQEMRDIWSTIR